MKKEKRMMSAHGNKFLLTSVFVCFIGIVMLLGGVLSDKRTKLKLYEKKYSAVISSLEKNNEQISQASGEECVLRN